MKRISILFLALSLAATLLVSFIALALSYVVEVYQAVIDFLCKKHER